MKMLFCNLATILENEFLATARSIRLTEAEYTILRVLNLLTPGNFLLFVFMKRKLKF